MGAPRWGRRRPPGNSGTEAIEARDDVRLIDAGSARAGDRTIIAVALVIVTAIVAMGAFSLLAARRMDTASRERSTELVVKSLERRASSLQRDLAAFAHWDESVLRTAYFLDVEWIHQNFGRWLHDTQRHDLSYVVLESGLAYASIEGQMVAAKDAPFDSAALMPLVRSVQAGYLSGAAQSGDAVQSSPARPRDLAHAFHAGYLRVSGRPALVGAISVTPDYGRVVSPTRMPPIVVTVLFLDVSFLGEMAEELNIRDPAVSSAQPSVDRQGVEIPLRDPQTPPAWLSWVPENPGTTLLWTLLPALLATTFLLLAIASIVLWHARRATRNLAQSEALAFRLAYIDPLCGLPNRAMLMRMLDDRLARLAPGARLAIFFLDLDGFKDINDTLGHHVGDLLLSEVGSRLKELPIANVIASRFGGDEFVIMVPVGSDRTEIEAVGAALLETIRQPVSVAGQTLAVGGSIGASVAPDHGTVASELIRLADIAVYRAKADGRGAVRVFERKMERDVVRRRDVELDLRRALAEGELTLYYQPQFTVDGEFVVGCEALVRWIHPVRGIISPAEFVPIAEESGLITELDMWVLRRACEQAKGWGDTKLAVNLSPVDFRMPDLGGTVARILHETGFPAERLEVEITENLLFGNHPEALAALASLRALGIRIALDDFGSGYSSLGYIRRFRVDTIKIDRSFTQNIGRTDDAAAIIDCVVRLAQALAITVTAEGVETREQLRYLQSVGCHHVQGFLLAKPVPVSGIDRYIERATRPAGSLQPRRQTV